MKHQPLAAVAGIAQHEGLALAERLVAVQGLIEGKFLAAGEVLCQAIDGIGGLIAGLDGVIEALDPATTVATTADLGFAAEKLLALPTAQFKRRQAVEYLLGHRQSLARCIAEMQRSLSYMRAYSINIKITASAISTGDPEFGLFAHEISQCIESGGVEIHGLETDIEALESELHKAQAHGAILEGRCNELIPAVPDELSASSAVIGQHHHKVASAAEAARRLASDVQTKVGRVLSALQIGDSTSQRIDHIQLGIRMLARAQAGLSPDQGERLGGMVHSLLAAQLTATMEDFTENVVAINAGMAALVDDLSELLRLRDAAYGRAEGEKDGFLRQLGRQIELALGLVMEIEAADRVATDTGTLVAGAANNLAARVASIQAIKADVNYMAINTTLRSRRVGEAGQPLRVVAVELGQHGGDLERSAAECVTVLDKLIRSATELGDDRSAEPDGETETRAAARALSAASARIHNAGDRTETDIATLADQGEALLGSLKRFSTRFDLPGEVGDTLDAVATDLAVLGSPTLPGNDDVAAPLRALLAELAALYTMAKERAVHEQLVEFWGINPLEPCLSATVWEPSADAAA